jgi:hypothetical protein
MKRKTFMKPHLVDFTFTAEDLIAAAAGQAEAHERLAPGLKVLQDSNRRRVQHLGTRNETFAMAAIEIARQHPQVVPPGIDMAALERDIVARQQLIPFLVRSRQYTRMLEDTIAMHGVDLFNGGRGIYKTLQIVGDLFGLADSVAQLGEHFARGSREEGDPTAGVTTTEPGKLS